MLTRSSSTSTCTPLPRDCTHSYSYASVACWLFCRVALDLRSAQHWPLGRRRVIVGQFTCSWLVSAVSVTGDVCGLRAGKQKTLEQLRREKVELENSLEQEQVRSLTACCAPASTRNSHSHSEFVSASLSRLLSLSLSLSLSSLSLSRPPFLLFLLLGRFC